MSFPAGVIPRRGTKRTSLALAGRASTFNGANVALLLD